MDRRRFIIGTGVAVATSRIVPAFAQTPDPDTVIVGELPPLPSDLAAQAASPPAAFVPTDLVGTAKPSSEEMDKAYEILVNSPFGGGAPVEVAQYFLAVGAGAYGQELRPFAREWPVRANPMIFHFFSSTQTKPEGDTTAWCAAFMNWCLLRAHAETADEIGTSPGQSSRSGKAFKTENRGRYSTNSASSGSFRCWEPIASPSRGQLAVFKNAGTDDMTRACLGTGHIAFYLKVPSTGWVQVLGGNQAQAGSNGAVTVANMKTTPGSRFMQYVKLKG